MNPTLGPITFTEEDLVLRGLDADRISVDSQRSDQGTLQILVADNNGGRALELYGWFTRAEEDSVLALSEGKAPVVLNHHIFTGQVFIVGTSCEDVFEYANPDPDDYRVGSIYLLEV